MNLYFYQREDQIDLVDLNMAQNDTKDQNEIEMTIEMKEINLVYHRLLDSDMDGLHCFAQQMFDL